MKQKDCSKYYIRVKRNTLLTGIPLLLSMMIWAMIPFVNLILLKLIYEMGQSNSMSFFEDILYTYEKIKVMR